MLYKYLYIIATFKKFRKGMVDNKVILKIVKEE